MFGIVWLFLDNFKCLGFVWLFCLEERMVFFVLSEVVRVDA